MSTEMRLALRTLSASMDKHIARVNEKLRKAGVSAKDPLVYSVAKYYVALDKLAEEK